MKKIILATALLTVIFAKDTTEYYKIEGMFCGNGCANRIKNVIKTVDGIKKCDVDFNSKTAMITYENEKINKQQIASIIAEKTYFKVTEKNKEKTNSFWNWLFGKG